jgi:hypothetical protein
MRLFITCFVLILLQQPLFSQRFGGTPTRVKWSQLNTDTARIIFPSGLDSSAQRIAAIVHKMAAEKPLALGQRRGKINIVLQNQTVVANGYVGLGPYRSEFYLTPAMNNFDQGSISWNDQLAIHEYRHVQQFNNFRKGLSRTMGILFGQEGYALAVNASVPDWFYEGDAVYNETALTRQGRGRLPLFLNAFPSLWKGGKNYSWMKLRNGSLKDYVPSHYHLGYLLVNYGYNKYGPDFWSKVTTDAASFKGLIYPFQKAIEKHAGVKYKNFYSGAFDYYKKLGEQKIGMSDSKKMDSSNVNPVNRQVVTNYLFPYSISADSMVYLKTSFDKRPAFYIKTSNGERLFRIKDISTDDQFSYRNGKIVYAAYETDPRWGWRDYSVIKLLDIRTNKQRTIGHKTKYFSPDISASGEKIAAVQVSTTGKSELHVLDTKTGEVLTAFKSADILLFTDPKFLDEQSLVTVVRLREGRTALAIADMNTGGIERLTVPSFNVSGHPVVSDGTIYFTASFGGNDDVYAIRLNDKKLSRITNGPLGNYFVNVAHGKVTWSRFTAEGYQLQQIDEKEIKKIPVPDSLVEMTKVIFPVSQDNSLPDILTGVTEREIPVSKYSKATGLLNFHSWRPYYEDPEFSFSLYGENILNTTQTELYYLYNENDRTHAAGFNFVYGGWFPYLTLGTQYTFDRQAVANNLVKEWNQLDSRIGLSVPLNWVRGKTVSNLGFGSSYVYRNDFNKGVNKNLFTDINFSYLSHFVSWGQQVQRAPQHIFPRLGYTISLNYRHAITNYTSWQPLITSSVFLPGIYNTHSIVLTGAFQETDTLNTLFGNRFPYSRGYNAAYFSRMWRASANYHFPILYPDFGFANIVYLQRIRGNVFYDMTRVYSTNKLAQADQRSAGGEIYLDTKWWNQHPLTFGFRVSYLMDNDFFTQSKGAVFEFILPVSIIPR